MTRDGRLTYWDLTNGHVLKNGDKIIIHGLLGYIEWHGSDRGYFLSLPGVKNDTIFSYLNIPLDSKYDFCPEGCLRIGEFPEYNSLENLQKCLIKLYETPFFKVGDIVRVRHREGEGIRYPYCFDTPMAELEGKVFKVKRISKEDSNAYVDRPFFNGDIQRYCLDAEASAWTWHRTMLELVTRASVQPEQHNRQQAEQAQPKMVLKNVNVVDNSDGEIRLKDPVIKSNFRIKV